MAHFVGFVSLASVHTRTWYSKHARMAVVYQLVLVHCGMTTVASAESFTRHRRMESKCSTGGTRNPLFTDSQDVWNGMILTFWNSDSAGAA